MSVVVEEVSADCHRELRDGLKRLKDLFRPNPTVYWSDLLASVGVGWGAFAACVVLAPTWPGVCCGVVAVLALYRAALFMHELAHLRLGEVPGFRAGWNLLVGYPLL